MFQKLIYRYDLELFEFQPSVQFCKRTGDESDSGSPRVNQIGAAGGSKLWKLEQVLNYLAKNNCFSKKTVSVKNWISPKNYKENTLG